MIHALLIAALAGVALALTAELASRWWIRRQGRYYVWTPRTRLEIRLATEVFPELDPRARFEVNAQGERGAEAPRDKNGLYRVLATGGSAVECFVLDQPRTWPAVLERLLNTPDSLQSLHAHRVHVGNIGHSGVGSAELDLILERVLPQYRHVDAILIMVGASDVYHWLEDGAPVSRPASTVPETLLFATHPRQPFGWKPRAWALVEVARRLHRSWLRPLEIKERAGAWFASARRMRAQATEVRTTRPDATAMVDHFERRFRSLVRRAMAYADRVIVMLQPWFEGDYTPEEMARFWTGAVGKPWKESVSVFYSLEVVNQLLESVHARAAQMADELGVECLSLRDVLIGRAQHYFDHDHYTPAGAAVVAQTVANTLLTRPVATQEAPAPRPELATALRGP